MSDKRATRTTENTNISLPSHNLIHDVKRFTKWCTTNADFSTSSRKSNSFSLSRFNVRNPAYHETHSNDEQNRLPIQIMVVFFHNRVS